MDMLQVEELAAQKAALSSGNTLLSERRREVDLLQQACFALQIDNYPPEPPLFLPALAAITRRC